jgi:dihydrolipoamide dehydrogenase
MADNNADFIVVGGGPGGYAAAFRAADLGRKVTLIDPRPALGGVCLNEGCIPSKALLHAAEVLREARHMGDWGISFGEPTIDLDRLRARKDDTIGKLTGGLRHGGIHRTAGPVSQWRELAFRAGSGGRRL